MNQIYALTVFLEEMEIDSTDLLTRDLGRKGYKKISQKLREIPDGETFTIDARGIKLIDSSFFDEAIIELFLALVEGQFGNRFLTLAHISQDSLVNIEGAVARRKLRTAIPVTDEKDTLHLVGDLEPNLLETLNLLLKRKELTARDLADHLQININNASNRLRRLFESRLAKRLSESSATGLFHRYVTII